MNLLFWSHQKKLRMLWRVEKDGRASHLVGTAHFFPYSFRRALTRLMRNVEIVMFEGPLDQASSEQIAAYGRGGNDLPAFVENSQAGSHSRDRPSTAGAGQRSG